MNCLICGSAMAYAFSKRFDEYKLDAVDYWSCGHCGFSVSKTHLEMGESEWQALNDDFHAFHFARADNPYNRNQRYFNQALMLHLLANWEIIERGEWLDWGSGEGRLALQLQKHFGLKLQNFDRYIRPSIHELEEEALLDRRFDLVVNTAVFEHVRSRDTLDEINSLVAPGGSLAVHTLVRGKIPRDPEWMYLLPVHAAFHTNRSMAILLKQWGYTCSVYNEIAKLWILFRGDPAGIRLRAEILNRFLGWDYLHFAPGFMAYWP